LRHARTSVAPLLPRRAFVQLITPIAARASPLHVPRVAPKKGAQEERVQDERVQETQRITFILVADASRARLFRRGADEDDSSLELVEEFGTAIALPVSGAEALVAATRPHAEAATAWAEWAHERYRTASAARSGDTYRAYAGTIAEHEREVGRRAHSFELNVEVLPLAASGVWWIGRKTVAVTDHLRADAAAFDDAIHPIIAELA
jgi:hypothetical protein